MYLDLAEKMLVFWNWIWCPRLMLCPAMTDLSGSAKWYCLTLVSVEQSSQCRPDHTQKEFCKLPVSSILDHPWLARQRWRLFSVGGWLTWCCADNAVGGQPCISVTNWIFSWTLFYWWRKFWLWLHSGWCLLLAQLLTMKMEAAHSTSTLMNF
jgi:hypothetical protein